MTRGAKIECRDTAGRLVGWWTCVVAADPLASDPHGKWEWHDT